MQSQTLSWIEEALDRERERGREGERSRARGEKTCKTGSTRYCGRCTYEYVQSQCGVVYEQQSSVTHL